MNKPVNYKLAKLLKEKDEIFDVVSTLDYPTIAEVVMWLYEKHNIWIDTSYSYNDNKTFVWSITRINEELNDNNIILSGFDDEIIGYNAPTEAYEKAIEYCLTNLIKQ